MAVAIAVATVTVKAARKVRMLSGKVIHRLKVDKGVRRQERVMRGAEVRKRPNIQFEARRTRLRALMISVGRAIVAPLSNSLRMISTGLNQYSVFGLEQLVISLP